MEDSLGKRYLIKLVSTLLITLVNSAVQFILPRALSVGEYANYTYNLNVFTSVLSIVILSMDGAFASKISKRLQESGLIWFYGKFILGVIAFLNVSILLVYNLGIGRKAFPGQTFGVVMLALNASLALKILQEVMTLFDCYALTRLSEPFAVLQRIGIAVLVYILYMTSILNLISFYLIQIMVVVLIVFALLIIFLSKNKDLFKRSEHIANRVYVSEFVQYCKPLVMANVVTNGLLLISNWLLKNYGGDTEQAYFGVAWQLNALLAYTFTPIIVLLQREYAIRVQKPNALSELYKDILKKTITLTSFFACFIFANAKIVLETLFGDSYVDAVSITQLIMLYTIFQAWGQVNGTMYTATERTGIYAKISIVVQMCSLGLIMLFQIPNFIWTSGLGAVGIGLQKTVGNLISVLLSGYFNCKYLKLRFMDEYRIAFMPALMFLIIAFLVRLTDKFVVAKLLLNFGGIIEFLFVGILYCLLCGFVLILRPAAFGVEKEIARWKERK